MRIAFLGKGGSGKTTITGAFARWLAGVGHATLAVDADMNTHLSDVLGCTEVPKSLGTHYDDIAQYVRGSRTDLGDRPILSTTPPSPNSRFIRFEQEDSFLKQYSVRAKGLSLLQVGKFGEADVGAGCYHTKLHSLCVVLNHLLDTEEQYVVVDATAGVDTLSTSLLISYDLTVFVVEPTTKSISVVKDYLLAAQSVAERVVVLANKVTSKEDLQFILNNLGSERLVGVVAYSSDLKRFEQGQIDGIDAFVQSNEKVFAQVIERLKKSPSNRRAMLSDLAAIHKKNCEWWYNNYHGTRLDTGLDHTDGIAGITS